MTLIGQRLEKAKFSAKELKVISIQFPIGFINLTSTKCSLYKFQNNLHLVIQSCLLTVWHTFWHSAKTLHSFSRLLALHVGYLLLSKLVVELINSPNLSKLFCPELFAHVALTIDECESKVNKVPKKI